VLKIYSAQKWLANVLFQVLQQLLPLQASKVQGQVQGEVGGVVGLAGEGGSMAPPMLQAPKVGPPPPIPLLFSPGVGGVGAGGDCQALGW